MAFSDRFLEELAARNEIVDVVSQYVRLTRKSGANMFGLCPFHSEKTPSFSVAPDKQIYHCFGCGKGGGVIGFIMEIENLSFRDAVAFLARRAGMPLPEEEEEGESASRRSRLLELNRDAARFYHELLAGAQGGPGQEYVRQRGISPAMVKAFGLGYAPDAWTTLLDAMERKGYSPGELQEAGLIKPGRSGGGYDAFRNRLLFPVIDVRGSVLGFSGRILGDGEPKYLNSPETPVFSKSHNLFALNLAKKSKSGYILLTEGNIDVVALHQAGFDGAVASLGTSLTAEQARLMARYAPEVVLCYDSDAAGRKAAQRAIGILEKLELKVRVLQLTGAKDPDEFIRSFGADAFRNALERSAGQVDYRLRLVAEKHPLDSDEDRIDYLREAEALLAGLAMPAERELYAARVAERAGVRREGVLQDVEHLRERRLAGARKREEREQTRPTRTAQPAQRALRYENPRSARAEEGILRLLYLDPGLIKGRTLPPPERFSSPLLGRLYRELLRRIEARQPVSMAVLAGQFTPEEMAHFTSVLTGTVDLSRGGQAMDDYIAIVVGSGDEQDGDLRELAEKYRKTKGYAP